MPSALPPDADPASRRWFAPATSGSSVTCDLDFEHEGRQVGSLNIAEPAAGQGWQSLAIPIACFRNGAGPTLLLLGGTHGDEVDGPVTLLKLIRTLQPEEIRGRVIVVPALNYAAVEACRRTAPADGRDLNRCFPGKADGSLAEVIAHYVDTALLPLCDLVLDLHAGGQALRYVPSLWLLEGGGQGLWERTLAAARAFGAPVIAVSESLGGDMSESAARHGCIYMSTEAGGGATVDPAVVTLSDDGIRRLLAHFDIIPADRAPPARPTALYRVLAGQSQVLASNHGLFEPAAKLGDKVDRGALLGWVHRVERPDATAVEIRAPIAGLLYGLRWMAHARRDAVLATIAVPA